MRTDISRLFRWSILAYALMLIPTGIWLAHGGGSDAVLSGLVTGVWQADFWQMPGLSSKTSRVVLDGLTWAVIGVISWLFFLGFKTLNKHQPDETQERQVLWIIFRWVLSAGLILLAVVPFHSSDLYGYINRGFQQSLLHTNPYLTPIADIPGWQEMSFLHDHWIHNPSPYGFFFTALAVLITRLGGSFTGAFLCFKAINCLLVLGTTGMIYTLAKRFGRKRPWLSAYLFGANPLVLLHAVGNGHNDILLVFLLLLSIWTLFSPRWLWLTLPLLTLSILTKYASLLALPFIGIYLFQKRSWRALVLGGFLSLMILGTFALLYIEPGQPWPWKAMLENAGKPQHSPIQMLAYLLYYPMKWLGGDAGALKQQALLLLKPLFWLVFALFYVQQLWRYGHSSNAQPDGELLLIERVALVIMAMIVFVSAKFHPWYPVMFLPLALLLPESSRIRRFALIFCFFQIAAFTLAQNIHVVNVLLLTLTPLWLTLKGQDWFKPALKPM